MIDSLYRSIFDRLFTSLSSGTVNVHCGEEFRSYGSSGAHPASGTALECNLQIHDGSVFRRLAWGGAVGAAEAYIDGHWTCDNLTGLLRIFTRDIHLLSRLNRRWSWLRQCWDRVQHSWKRNTVNQARRNIHEHYDLGNDFFARMLDCTMNYSSGIFQHPDDSMFLSSIHKMARICHKLRLGPDDHLLEIGTGWGGLAIFAAHFFGCRVTTTTISEEQYLLAKERVERAGLSQQIEVVKLDYRALSGTYSKLVSIEMIEAVGQQYWAEFFRKCQSLLEPSGLMLLQSIVIRDNWFQTHVSNVDFIRKYIFPGGCLPSNSHLLEKARGNSELQLLNLEDIGTHYARTLELWRERFNSNRAAIISDGFRDERFLRMWEYYLCYCEAGFLERHTNNVQLLFGGRRHIDDAPVQEIPRDQVFAYGRDWLQLETPDSVFEESRLTSRRFLLWRRHERKANY